MVCENEFIDREINKNKTIQNTYIIMLSTNKNIDFSKTLYDINKSVINTEKQLLIYN